MVLTIEEKMSMTFWWIVAVTITTYLFWGVLNTLRIILQ
jgi:hypothetical protein